MGGEGKPLEFSNTWHGVIAKSWVDLETRQRLRAPQQTLKYSGVIKRAQLHQHVRASLGLTSGHVSSSLGLGRGPWGT